MKPLLSAVLVLAAALPARAHFVWLLPGPAGDKQPTVRVVFSEGPEPDRPELLDKIAHAELFVRGADGKTAALKHAAGQDALEAVLPGAGPWAVAGVCRYGVFQRGKAEPFLLEYYAKTFVGLSPQAPAPALVDRPLDKLTLEVVPVLKGKGAPALRVLWQGKPAVGAPVWLLPPGKGKGTETRADADGLVKLPARGGNGLYAVRALHVEDRPGEYAGKRYKAVRHYATLTVPVFTGAGADKGSGRAPASRPAGGEKLQADPAATKLLADARAARATWEHFPGFTADLEVNVDGTVAHGSVEVSPKGKVTLKLGAGAEGAGWARHTLDSIVGHRLDGGTELDTPCAFADDNARHPLGRAIRVLNDEFHSSYRIRDRQVIVVNREMRDARFTITVLENVTNAEKHFLPACYVVNTWDRKTDALTSSAAHHQTWQRVGKFDLPLAALVVTAGAGKQGARSLKLSHHRLLPSQGR